MAGIDVCFQLFSETLPSLFHASFPITSFFATLLGLNRLHLDGKIKGGHDYSLSMEFFFFFCRHKGESREREESRLNMDSRLNWTMRGEIEEGESKRGATNQEAVSAKRPKRVKGRQKDLVTTMAGLHWAGQPSP